MPHSPFKILKTSSAAWVWNHTPAKDCRSLKRMVFLGQVNDTVKNFLVHLSSFVIGQIHQAPKKKKKTKKKLTKHHKILFIFISLQAFPHLPLHEAKRISMLSQLPKKINHFSPSLDHLSDLHWWKCFLPAYHLISSSPWINRSTHFCTDVGFTGIGCLFKSHFFHSTCLPFIDLASLSIFLLKMWTITM